MEYFSAADDADDAALLAAQPINLRHPCHLRLKNIIIRMEPTVSEAKPPRAGSTGKHSKLNNNELRLNRHVRDEKTRCSQCRSSFTPLHPLRLNHYVHRG